MSNSFIAGTVHVETLTATNFTPPNLSITNAAIVADAQIAASKIVHRQQPVYAQNGNADSAADRRAVHVVKGATATIGSFAVGSKTACTGDSTITVNLLKNGSSVLSAAVVLDSGNTAFIVEAGTVSSPNLVVGDVLEVSVTVSAGSGTLGDGVFAVTQIDEVAN